MADDDLILRAQLRDELSGGLKNIRTELARTEAAAKGLGITGGKQTAPGLDKVTSSASKLRSEAQKLDRGLVSMSTSLGAGVERAAKRGAIGIGVIGGAIGAFGL